MSSGVAASWPIGAGVRIRNAGRFVLEQRGFRHRYLHDTWAFHLHGYAGVVRIGGVELELRAGDVTVSPPGVASAYDLAEAGTHLCVHAWADPPRRGSRVGLPLRVRPWAGSGEWEQRFWWVIDLHARSSRNPAAGEAARAAVSALALAIGAEGAEPASSAGGAGSGAAAAVRKAAALLTADLRRPLDVPALAREVGLSQNYLASRFRRRYGVTMQRYLLRARVEHARLLLATTDLPVKAIAARVGLPDAQHFNKRFRAVAGVSPSAVRRGGS